MDFVVGAVLAAEGGVNLNPFEPQFGLYVWTLVAFAAVFYMLARSVFPRLQETLADREQRIKEDLEKAEETKRDAERVLEEYKARVAQAREEANRVIDEGRQSADAVRKDLIARAEAEARLIVDKAQKSLRGERDRAVQELQAQVAEWSVGIASRIVARELNPESQRELVETFIREVQEERS